MSIPQLSQSKIKEVLGVLAFMPILHAQLQDHQKTMIIQEEEIVGLEKIVEERDEQIKRLKKFMLKIMREKVQAEAENVRLKEEIEENECCKSVMWVS